MRFITNKTLRRLWYHVLDALAFVTTSIEKKNAKRFLYTLRDDIPPVRFFDRFMTTWYPVDGSRVINRQRRRHSILPAGRVTMTPRRPHHYTSTRLSAVSGTDLVQLTDDSALPVHDAGRMRRAGPDGKLKSQIVELLGI